jgi:hypothetical protein
MRRPVSQECDLEMENKESGEVGHEELLRNIRRLTIAVLDNLEQGSQNKTMDQAEKRPPSSTGSRLLRLWRSTLKDNAAVQTGIENRNAARVLENPDHKKGT